MTDTDRTLVKTSQAGEYAKLPMANNTPQQMAATVNQRAKSVRFIKDILIDSSAASAVAVTYKVDVFDRKVQIVSARVWCDSTLASNTSLGCQITLVKDNDSSASTNTSTTVATGPNTAGSSGAVALVAGVSQAMTISTVSGATTFASGDSLYVKQAKTGAGIAMGNWGVSFVLEEV